MLLDTTLVGGICYIGLNEKSLLTVLKSAAHEMSHFADLYNLERIEVSTNIFNRIRAGFNEFIAETKAENIILRIVKIFAPKYARLKNYELDYLFWEEEARLVQIRTNIKSFLSDLSITLKKDDILLFFLKDIYLDLCYFFAFWKVRKKFKVHKKEIKRIWKNLLSWLAENEYDFLKQFIISTKKILFKLTIKDIDENSINKIYEKFLLLMRSFSRWYNLFISLRALKD